jgi:hypothetical protein
MLPQVHARASTLAGLLCLPVVLAAGASPTSSTAAMPSPWVLLEWSSGIRIYLDSTRVERHRPDSLAGVWLRFIHTHPQPGSLAPNPPMVKQIDVHVGLNCRTLQDHAYYLTIRDSLDRVLAEGPVSPTGQQQTDAALIAKNSVGVACAWLRDPGRPAIHFSAP